MIKVGVIGLGRSGWELHAEPLSKFEDYKLSAVCDRNDARRASATEAFGAKPYSDAGDLIGDPELDLVVISAPSNLHAELAIAALNAGKHVIVEKPMALTLAETDAMVATAEDTGRLLTVFHNRHWDRDYQMLKRLVQRKVLGELLTLDSRVMTYGPEWTTYGVPEFNPTWRIQAAYGGGFLADWGPHLVEQLLDLTDETPATVTCELRSHLWATEVEDYFHIRLVFPSGLLATIEGSNNARAPLPRWFVVGSSGTLTADGTWGCWTDMHIRGDVADIPMDLHPQDVGPSSGGRNYDVGEELSAQFYEDLAGALTGTHQPAITVKRARDVMVVLEAARRSSASGQTVELS
jgi:predicted dehydrogenase